MGPDPPGDYGAKRKDPEDDDDVDDEEDGRPHGDFDDEDGRTWTTSGLDDLRRGTTYFDDLDDDGPGRRTFADDEDEGDEVESRRQGRLWRSPDQQHAVEESAAGMAA